VYGSGAGFSASGTESETAAPSVGFLKHYSQQNVWFRTEFDLAEYRDDCLGVPLKHRPKKHGYCPTSYEGTFVLFCVWTERSDGWFGGASWQCPKTAPATSYDNCAIQYPDTFFDSDRGVAVRWSQRYEIRLSVNIKAANLKAKYTSSAQTGRLRQQRLSVLPIPALEMDMRDKQGPSKAAQLAARDNLPPR
jgi:hypothetical protein